MIAIRSFIVKVIIVFIIWSALWVPIGLYGVFEKNPHALGAALIAPIYGFEFLLNARIPLNNKITGSGFNDIVLPFIIFWSVLIVLILVVYYFHRRRDR
jgi:hypothetical protein